MDGGMGGMMAWMMGLGLLGWVLIAALLATLIIVVVRLLGGSRSEDDRLPPPGQTGRLP